MPGPGPARDGAARLRDGLEGWRRYVARQRCAAAARRWSLIALGAALAGVAAGRLDGSPLLTAVAVSSVALTAGVVRVARSRKVSADEAARLLDATFGLDEQVATALCCVSVPGPDQNPLVASLIERAAGLVEQVRPRPAPAYGEWAALAMTAAAVAAVAAAPGSHPARGAANVAGGPRTAERMSATPGASGPVPAARPAVPAAPSQVPAARPAVPASGAATPAPRTAPRAPGTRPASASPAGPGSSASSGQRQGVPDPGGPARTVSGAPAGSGQQTAAAATGSGQRGTGPAGTASSQPGSSQPSSGQRGPGPPGAGQPGTGQHTARARAGVPGGDTAGRQPGTNRTGNGLTLPAAGGRVLLIVLPGADGTATARVAPGKPGQRAGGNGGTATASTPGADTGSGAAYVLPDDNEVPLADQGLLGRYF